MPTVLDDPAPSTESTRVTPVTILIADDSHEAEWDGYVERHPDATGDHVWRWRTVFRDVFGHDCVYLMAYRGGAIAGVLPLVCFRSRIFGRFLVSLPFLNYGGLLVTDVRAAEGLVDRAREIAREFGASHLEFRHSARQLPHLPFRQHKLGLLLPLPASSDALWNGLDRKVRNQVRKAQKEGLTATPGGVELIDEFYSVFARNMRDLGTPVYPKQLFAETLALFPRHAKVFVVRRGTVTMAAAVAIGFRDTVLVPWASSLREFRHLCPNMLLYWAMLEGAVANGARTFDFGRSSADAGTHHFKLQWGATETPLHWEYLLLTRNAPPDTGPSNSRFALAIECWRRLPLSFTTAVGPSIVRNIP